MDTSGGGFGSGASRARGVLGLVLAVAAIGCEVPLGARAGGDDASVATSALRIDEHLPEAFRDPHARFAARARGSEWVFARAGLDATLNRGSGALALQVGGVDAHVELVEVARGSERTRLGAPTVSMRGARARITHDEGIEELFVHGEPGIEHLVSLARVPVGGGPLEVVVALRGASAAGRARLDVSARAARVIDPERGVVLVYEGVRAWDARGVELAAWMEADPRGVRLVIDDAGATPPIVIDPLIAMPETVLSASDRAGGDGLGYSLDLEGDVAVAGAPYRAGGGAAYVFERGASGWVERARLVAPGALDGEYGGWSVAISGDTIAVGSPRDNHPIYSAAGAVDVYRRVASGWQHEARLVNPDPVTSGERFGFSVAIAGDVLVVGAIGDQTSGFAGSGAAYVYRRSGTTWSSEGALVYARASSNDSFGDSVATDGTRVIVGAPYENGLVLDADGFTLNQDVGAFFVFERAGTAWIEQARVAASPERSFEYLGESIALDGDRVIAGATGIDDDESLIRSRGGAYVFTWNGATWAQEARLTPSAAADWSQLGQLGTSVAISGTTVALGAPGALSNGLALVFQRVASSWSQVARLPASGSIDELGSATALEGTRWMVGAYEQDFPGGTDQGAVHVLALVESGAQGQRCTTASECTSGFCVDGVCCDVACAGGPNDCQACSVAAGVAVDGTCAPRAAGTSCRSPVGACDAGETCDGVATVCPADARLPAGSVCRPANGPCDAEERCTGSSITCPFDAALDDGTACDDGSACNGADACSTGSCRPTGLALGCDDDDACTADSCAEPGGCVHTPIDGCCDGDEDCDDADACTADSCAGSTCAHAPIAGCSVDAGLNDAGPEDAGAGDAGAADAGEVDGGAVDAGARGDAGAERDAGASIEPSDEGGCGCATPGRSRGSPVAVLLVAMLIVLGARTRRRRCRS